MWEGLTALHPETTDAIAGVAYLPPEVSPDKKRYVFTLRPEARWSNGDPVTAHDYIRAWRRAIEPGTADVYAELIADHLAGARAYVSWRLGCIEALSLVRQLQRGSKISPDEARKLFTGPFGREIAGQVGLTPEVAAATTQPGAPEEAALSSVQSISRDDWKRIGDDLLKAHWHEMKERFEQVGMRAIDDHYLEVRLSRPTAYFLDLTAFSTYLPVHKSIEILRDRYGDLPLTNTGLCSYDQEWTKPDYHRNGYPGVVCNGPYILKEWQFKTRMRFEANPMYWNAAAVRSKSIETVDIEYSNTAFMIYEQGLVDMMSDLTMDYTPNLVKLTREGKRNDMHAIPSFGTYEYTINCRPELPAGVIGDAAPNPLADARVRRALAMAIDKRDMIDNAFPRLDNPVATTFVPPGSIPGYKSPKGLLFDPERARAELAAAGYPGGKGFPVLPLLYNTGFQHEVGAQAIKRMWERELGISVNLIGKETKIFAEDKVGGRFAVARGGWFGDYNDPTTFLDLYESSNGHNVGKYSDSRYDELLARAGKELDPQRRLDLLSEAERILMEEGMAIIPLYQYVMVYSWPPNVTGLHPNPRLQFPLQYVHVERR